MRKLCLIQTSQNRKSDLLNFVESLNNSLGVDFKIIQYIFVDQGDNKCCFEKLNKDISFLYIPYAHASLSEARNIGLSYADAEYVCFPDDDCWYDSDTLKNVLTNLAIYKDGIAIVAKDENNKFINKFGKKAGYLSKYRQYGVLSISIFVKFYNEIKFDEYIGVGTKKDFGSGEETDYILRLIKHKHLKIRYLPSVIIRHPSTPNQAVSDAIIEKTYKYGKGYGYVLKKNNYFFLYVLYLILRPFVGFIFYKLIGKDKLSKKSYARFQGIKDGFWCEL